MNILIGKFPLVIFLALFFQRAKDIEVGDVAKLFQGILFNLNLVKSKELCSLLQRKKERRKAGR
jgi:hypothetical protein